MAPEDHVTDLLQRPLRDLRISVTDRCNLRCTYCMPREIFGPDYAFMPAEKLLTFAEVERVARAFASIGVTKLRLTGGEPLLRSGLERLVERLASIPGIADVALTTNGVLLTPARARRLREAGLNRVTVSLDSLRDEVFMAMNDARFPVRGALDAVEAARQAGLAPVKVNMVVKRGWNDGDILAMAGYFRETGDTLRFIEYMDVGHSNGWRLGDVVTAAEILERVESVWPLEELPPARPGEVATRYRYRDGRAEIGVIAAVTRPFCGGCNRARLSADGMLYTCLFAERGTDLRTLLREGADAGALARTLAGVWRKRSDRYSELRSMRGSQPAERVEMSHIGG